MKYPPEHIEALAAEYVLGTLHGRARRRFQAVLQQRADARLAVWRWEQQWARVAGSLAPLRPPRRVWRGVQQQISPARKRAAAPLAWATALAASLAASLAVVVLATYLLLRPVAPVADRLAVFADEQSAALWVVNTDLEHGRYTARAVAPPAPPVAMVYELWVVPEAGDPRSMGLLPTTAGIQRLDLSAGALAALPDARALAISIEPPGGSPTGLPTGPVVYQASLVRL